MSEQWQIRRGTTQENDDFTGAEGEVTMDTEKKQLRVHDGQTQGGWTLPNLVQAMQAMCPDYSRDSSITALPFTATSYGWVALCVQRNDSYMDFKVNDHQVASGGGSYNDRGWCFIPVSPGDVVSITAGSLNWGHFYPFKGN